MKTTQQKIDKTKEFLMELRNVERIYFETLSEEIWPEYQEKFTDKDSFQMWLFDYLNDDDDDDDENKPLTFDEHLTHFGIWKK